MYSKRILIDFRHIDKKNGFSTYLIMILKAIDSVDREFFLLVNENDFDFDEYIKTNKNVKFIKAKSKPFSFSQNYEIPLLIKRNKIDLYHAINYDIPLFMFLAPKCKLIATIHDLIPIVNKNIHKRSIIKNIYFEIMFRLCSFLSDRILTVSEYSKNDIVKYLKVNPNKVTAFHCSFRGKEIPEKTDFTLHKPLRVFFIGNNFEHKNILAGIEAAEILKNKNIGIVFNIAGQRTQYTDELENYIKEHNLEETVNISGKISEAAVDELFKTSDVFLFPSLAEGFGSPLLEAMNYGLPIVSSNKTVMPEVIGDAGILTEPHPENIAEKIEFIIHNPQVVSNLAQKGYERMQSFSQEKFNKNILSVYTEVSNG